MAGGRTWWQLIRDICSWLPVCNLWKFFAAPENFLQKVRQSAKDKLGKFGSHSPSGWCRSEGLVARGRKKGHSRTEKCERGCGQTGSVL